MDTVIAAWCESPGASLSVRFLTKAAGTSASSIDYHFDSLEQLYVDAQQKAVSAAKDWLDSRIDEISGLRSREMSAAVRAAIIATMIDDWCEQQRPLAMARIEACAAARRGSGSQCHGQWLALWANFWREFSVACGLADHAHLLAAFFDGESVQHLLQWNRTLDRALLDETVFALICHVEGRSLAAAQARAAYQELAEAGYSNLVSNKGVAVDPLDVAAAEILAESGLAAVTFRAVAERASTTLGNASYHFGSKSRLLRRAFEQLYWQALDGGVMESFKEGHDDMIEIVLSGITEVDHPILRAFDEITLHISRDEEYHELRGIIRAFPDPAADVVLRGLLPNYEVVPPSLSAAFSSICRGVDHMTLCGATKEETKLGRKVLLQFLRYQ